jgi:hypothetical protein
MAIGIILFLPIIEYVMLFMRIAFMCEALETVNLKKATGIGDYAFSECTGLSV